MDTVFFSDMQTDFGKSLENKFEKIVDKLDLNSFIEKNEIVAVKLHVGERGNLGYTNHNFARVLVEKIKQAGGKPYLTDTNTLYSGGRHNGVDHAVTAIQHGFTYATTGAPFIPADGVRGLDYIEVEINQKNVKKAKLAAGVLKADKVIFLNHFKGHLEAGFGGAIKNMAMGVASVAGKLEQHCNAQPEVSPEKCVGCRQCYHACPANAIYMEGKKAHIDYEKCIGCGQCVAACNYEAMNPKWDSSHQEFMEKLCEYAYAVDHYFGDKALYVNFAMNITPDCDCWPHNDVPFVQDVGILGSKNPLALDRATLDLVNKSPKNPFSRYAEKIENNQNVFTELREQIHSDYVFEYCKSMGMDPSYDMKTIK
ncbi:MAG: DUF362 domain-containing protein [Spirochaetia bacterium]